MLRKFPLAPENNLISAHLQSELKGILRARAKGRDMVYVVEPQGGEEEFYRATQTYIELHRHIYTGWGLGIRISGLLWAIQLGST